MSETASSVVSVPSVQQPRKLSCKARNDQIWERFKDEVFQIYVKNDATLRATMQLIEEKHGFTASSRKWKMKLKEWNFEKYLRSNDMHILAGKDTKRKLDGKKSTFVHNGNEITEQRLETFKKRKLKQAKAVGEVSPVSPGAVTPSNVTYHTPGIEDFSVMDICDSAVNFSPDSTAANPRKAYCVLISQKGQFRFNGDSTRLGDLPDESINQKDYFMHESSDILPSSKGGESEIPDNMEIIYIDSSFIPGSSLTVDAARGDNSFVQERTACTIVSNNSRKLESNSKINADAESIQKIPGNDVNTNIVNTSPQPQVNSPRKFDSLEGIDVICDVIRKFKVALDGGIAESAENQLRRAVSSSPSFTSSQREHVLKDLYYLIDESQHHPKEIADQCNMIFDALIFACEQNFGFTDPMTLRGNRIYADQLMSGGDYHRAKMLIKRVLDVSRRLSGESIAARLQSGSALSLCYVDCGDERTAIATFVTSVSEYLASATSSNSTPLGWNWPVRDHSGLSRKGSPGRSIARRIIKITNKIRKACTNGYCLEDAHFRILLQALNTADTASIYQQYHCSGSLWREIQSSLNLLSYSWCWLAKILVHLGQSSNHERQNLYNDSGNDILRACTILTDNRNDCAFSDILKMVQDLWKRSETKHVFQSSEKASVRDTLSSIIEQIDYVLSNRAHNDDYLEIESVGVVSTSAFTNASSTIGVTFSEGSLSGIGIRNSDLVNSSI